MIKIESFKKDLGDDIESMVKVGIHTNDNLAFFATKGPGNSFNIYDCKEEFCYDFDNETERVLFSGLNFNDSVETKIKHVNNFANILSNIENLLEIPNDQKTSIKLVRFDYKKLYKGNDYSYIGFSLNQKSSFWFKSPLKIELFCCLFKTLIGSSREQTFKTKQSLYDFLNSYKYFCERPVIWALDNCKTIARVLGLQSYNEERRFLYNFQCNGILSALEEYTDYYYNEDEDEEDKRRAIKNFKYNEPKQKNRVLLSKP